MLWQVKTGAIFNTAPYSPSAGGGGASYTYLGQFSSSSLPSGVVTMPFTMTNTAGLLVVQFGLQNSKTITSVVYDSAGSNVSLTQDVFNNTGNTVGIWSGVVPADSGSKNVSITVSGGAQFLGAGGHAWIVSGLSSNLVKTTQNAVNVTTSVAVSAGDFMFGGALNLSGPTGVNWATSTVAPGSIHANTNNVNHGADWTIASTNASFSCTPKTGTSFNQVYATYS